MVKSRALTRQTFPALAAVTILMMLIVAFGSGVHGQSQTPPPPISNVQVSNLSTFSATISWTTDTMSEGVVWYGKTASYSDFIPTSAAQQHQTIVRNLEPVTTYHFKIESRDSNTIKASTADMTFTTLLDGQTTPAPEQTQPGTGQTPTTGPVYGIISNVQLSTISQTEATISWQTSISAEGMVKYGLTDNYSQFIPTGTGATSQRVVLSGLTANTTYHYQIIAKQGVSSQSMTPDLTFKTLEYPIDNGAGLPGQPGPTDQKAPAISKVSVKSQSPTSVVVTWETDELATTNLSVGLTSDYMFTWSSTKPRTSHRVVLNNLRPDTKYHYQVYSKDAAQNKAWTKNATFTTTGTQPDNDALQPPTISNIKVNNITATSAVITWQTNEPANYQLSYGKKTTYSRVKTGNKYSTTHQVKLTDLEPNTTYNYRISVADEQGNVNVSANRTFITAQ